MYENCLGTTVQGSRKLWYNLRYHHLDNFRRQHVWKSDFWVLFRIHLKGVYAWYCCKFVWIYVYFCIFFRTHMHQMFVTLVSQPDGKFSRNLRREVKWFRPPRCQSLAVGSSPGKLAKGSLPFDKPTLLWRIPTFPNRYCTIKTLDSLPCTFRIFCRLLGGSSH